MDRIVSMCRQVTDAPIDEFGSDGSPVNQLRSNDEHEVREAITKCLRWGALDHSVAIERARKARPFLSRSAIECAL